MARPRMLGVLLCYNDGDILGEAIEYLLNQHNDVIAWDHGSTDQTPQVIEKYRSQLLETKHIPREFDFYKLYPTMSQHLMDNHVKNYDWISWPDQDEFLEGPTRAKGYAEAVEEVVASRFNWVMFNNYNFWFTTADDPAIASTTGRIRHYSLFHDCPPRIRAWRASATNIREFNHNPPLGGQFPQKFNLRHYPMRSREQMMIRITKDRAGLRRGGANVHYENMQSHMQLLEIGPEKLHTDDGTSELKPDPILNWRSIYGSGAPAAPKKKRWFNFGRKG